MDTITVNASPALASATVFEYDSVPADCTPSYAKGWEHGTWWVRHGGSLMAELVPRWTQERADGFCDRLALERRHRAALSYFTVPVSGVHQLSYTQR